MVYIFLASLAIYLILVAACNSNQKNDACFTGLRTFIGALALIALVDFMTGVDISTTDNRDTPLEQRLSLSSAEAGLPISNKEKFENIEKNAGHYRLESRAKKFLAQGERDFITRQATAKRVHRTHKEDHMRLAARTAMLGILLRQVGK